MSAPSVGVKDKIVAASIGTFGDESASWPIFISKLPDESDNCIAVFDSGGLAPEPIWLLDYPTVTVLVRGTDYPDVYAKGKAIKDTLLGITAQDVNGDRWCGVIMIGDMTFIGRDKKDRPQFSLTFRLFVEPADTSGNNRNAL